MSVVAGDRTPAVRPDAPYLCAGLHAAALALMAAVLAPGTEVTADVAARARHVAAHGVAWPAAWMVWMASALSLLAFYAWWGRRVTSVRATAVIVSIAAVGAACDLTGERIYAFVLPSLASAAAAGDGAALAAFAAAQASATTCTALWANGLYTAAGIALTLRTPGLGRWTAGVAWTAWVAGAALSLAAAMGAAMGIAAASAVLFPAFIALCLLLPRDVGGPRIGHVPASTGPLHHPARSFSRRD